MYFHSLNDFFAMGGYAFYVWMAYGISLLLVVSYALALRGQNKRIKRRIKRLAEREADPTGVES